MKIDYVITGMNVGGAEMQVVELLLELKRCGHSVRLISLTPPVDLIDRLIRNNIPVVSLGMKSKLGLPFAAFKLAEVDETEFSRYCAFAYVSCQYPSTSCKNIFGG